ncbi:PAAR domain-containing protein [Aeromonas veronii]|uniref:PAAR domain-containing protein n=1 Tax=Aeromonas veronii TaxID=654 RepID=UPI0018F257DD|nr:PAAR domain-containing protein [Aeromonas veronii]MBJ7593195.1 PAAR domain-containing protein [Aeromonas veronii]
MAIIEGRVSKKAATVGDIGTDHDGFPPTPIIEGSQDIIIDNKPAARVGDKLVPHAKPGSPPHEHAAALQPESDGYGGLI